MPQKNKNNAEHDDESSMRLQKYLAQSGVASRRKAEELILEGVVRVNGNLVRELGYCIDPAKDMVTVEGRRVKPRKPKYILLHKPKNVVSSREDPQKRPTVIDLLPDVGSQLFPVGRLDYDATGLMLLTNDGELAMAMTHPSHETPKIYLVKVKGVPDEKDLNRLRRGVRLEDGTKTKPAKVLNVEVKRRGRKTTANSWLKFILKEGRNRQIKRMCAAVHHPALRIERVMMGPLKLGDLKPGEWRYASKEEISNLKKLVKKPARKRS